MSPRPTPAGGLRARLDLASEVAAAIAAGDPVVALESTLISHGLPWPDNLAVARESEVAVRAAGAVPATIAVHAGRVAVGLGDAALEALARADAGSVRKATPASVGAILAAGGLGATTVSGTMLIANAAGIAVVATGGIGGVHRGALAGVGAHPPTFDISTDLEALATTPLAVVCSGPKAILDVAATLEYLETRGVPVVAVGQDELPGFYARGSGLPAPIVAADLNAAADIVRVHRSLDLGRAILVCIPAPAADALADDVARKAIEAAVVEADAAGVAGPALTPWLLARVAALTDGRSIRANRALIVNNAAMAGRLAVLLAGRDSRTGPKGTSGRLVRRRGRG